jgi:hypothetical protein
MAKKRNAKSPKPLLLTKEEKGAAIQQAALAKASRSPGQLPAFCVNCGSPVKAQAALDSTEVQVSFCPRHGVRLRPDGSCPLEDDEPAS